MATNTASVTEFLPGSETVQAISIQLVTVSESLPGSERVYTANNGAYVVEKLTGSESVSAQSITTSAPTAPMMLSDLAIQYARLRASWVNPYFKILATSLYGAGNNTNTSAITGALDVVLAGETIANSHTMRTTNDVKAFLQSYSYQDMELQDAPAAYYRLGETSGTSVLDSTMLNGAGTINGGVALGTPGAIVGNPSTSMTFNGSSGYIALPASIDPSTYTSGFSVELWMQYSSAFPGSPRLIANDNVTVNLKGFELGLFPSASGGMFFNIALSGISRQAITSGIFSANTWYHLAAVYNGSSIVLYVNGQVASSTAYVGSITATTNTIQIGNTPGTSNYFGGSLDEVAIYNYALPASKVLTHFNVGMGAV